MTASGSTRASTKVLVPEPVVCWPKPSQSSPWVTPSWWASTIAITRSPVSVRSA
ncbi:hypothetical protein [Curtobacterium sp. MCPF17_052]|uniref:hypothetical protein n=1 Tax=Curtobacterium sp. MCPF17_052 TaxID=2175655 RepID=UPI003463A373